MFREMEARNIRVADGKLVEVNFGGKSFGDGDCAKLAGLTDLEILDLGQCQLTDAGLDHVAKLTSLDSLSLETAKGVTDAGIARLGGLTKLTNLNVGGTQATDASLDTIGKLTNLQKLSLVTLPGITDAGLPKLDGLKQLNEVWLSGTSVTPEGAKAFLAAHPGVILHGVETEDEEEGATEAPADGAAPTGDAAAE